MNSSLPLQSIHKVSSKLLSTGNTISPRNIAKNVGKLCIPSGKTTPKSALKSFTKISNKEGSSTDSPFKTPRLQLFSNSYNTPHNKVIESLTEREIRSGSNFKTTKNSKPILEKNSTENDNPLSSSTPPPITNWKTLLLINGEGHKYLSPHRWKNIKKVKRNEKNLGHGSPLLQTPKASLLQNTIKEPSSSHLVINKHTPKNVSNLESKVTESSREVNVVKAKYSKTESKVAGKSIFDRAYDRKNSEYSLDFLESICTPISARYLESFSRVPDVVTFDTPVRDEVFRKGLDGFHGKPHILGRGGFGTVILADSKGKKVAVKIIKKLSKRRQSIEVSIQNEENAIQLYDHPNVVRTFDVFGCKEPHTLVVMEFAGNRHLAHILENVSENINEGRRLSFAFQVASAIQWCHQKNVVHLDVKPANVIVNSEDVCKLGDFGCSKRVDKPLEMEDWHLLGGTIAYRAPELLCRGLPTLSADVYSFGITLWQILTRQRPFCGWDPHVIVYKVVSCDVRPSSPPGNDDTTISYINLYSKLWIKDRYTRPSMDDVVKSIQHLWEAYL